MNKNSRNVSFLVGFGSFPGDATGKEPACQCRRRKRCEFYPWVRKIPWRRAWQPTPVFFPGKFHGQRSLVSSVGLHRVRHVWSNLSGTHRLSPSMSPSWSPIIAPTSFNSLTQIVVVLMKFTPFGPVLEIGAIVHELGIDKVVLDLRTGYTLAHLAPMPGFLFRNSKAGDVSLLVSKFTI